MRLVPLVSTRQTQAADVEPIVPYARLYERLESLRAEYAQADPYPHVVLPEFLWPDVARRVLAEFPPVGGEWIHYVHFNERKFGRTDRASFPPTISAVVAELNSRRFLRFLGDLTGIDDLLPDETLEGGGLHRSERGGFLNVHADFTVHPHRPDWRRRLNVIVYLNPVWEESYGGYLELWDAEMRECRRRIAPVLNSCVIFNTDATSFHGHPDPMTCPTDTSRRSLALYYFTKEVAPVVRSTEYRARPGEGLRGLGIYLDKMALRAYDRTKRALGIDDRIVSRLLALLAGRRR
jgi:hypothetical protein